MYAGEIVERGPLDLLYHAPRPPVHAGCCSPRRPISTGLDEPVRLDSGRAAAARPADRRLPVPAALRLRLRRLRRCGRACEQLAARPRRRLPPQRRGCPRERDEPTAARGRRPRRPLPDPPRPRRRRSLRRPRQAGARRRGRVAVAAAGRDARARRRVGLRQDDDGAGGAAARRSGRPGAIRFDGRDLVPLGAARAAAAAAPDPGRLPGSVRVARPAASASARRSRSRC